MIKRIALAGFVLLIVFNIFPQENNVYDTPDEVLVEKVENYLNKMCGFARIFLNLVIDKLYYSGKTYVHLDEDVPAKIELNSDYIDISIDDTHLDNPTIYLTLKALLLVKDEAELVGIFAHELAHLSSLYDRKYQPTTEDEYLNKELVADRIEILVLSEMGYEPLASANLFIRFLSMPPEDLLLTSPRDFLIYRFLAAKKLADEIYQQSGAGQKYYKYLYLSETEFKAIKTIVKYLQNKQEKSGK